MKIFKLSAITSLFNAGFYLATSLIVLYFSDIGMPEFLIGLAMTLARLSYGLSSMFSGAMSDRVGRYYPMLIGFILGALSMLFLSLLRSQYLAITMVILVWVAYSIYSPAALALVSEVSRGTATSYGWLLLLPDGGPDSGPGSLGQYNKVRRLWGSFRIRWSLKLDLSSADLALVQG
jgi:MFS family permease